MVLKYIRFNTNHNKKLFLFYPAHHTFSYLLSAMLIDNREEHQGGKKEKVPNRWKR